MSRRTATRVLPVGGGLEVRLRKRVPGFELDTGWRVGAGFTVLFGYSGAGKSLTLSMIAGTMRADLGWVVAGGETLCDTRTGVFVPPQRRRVGYVPQAARLFPHLSVRRNVAFGLAGLPRGEREARTGELLEAFGVAALAEKRPHELSGGQTQRVALARALAPRPRLLLLDEPFSALDLPVRAETRDLLRRVHAAHDLPVVLVTHDLYEACALADTLVVYSGDGVVQVGPPSELVADPGTPALRRLLRSVELPPAVLASRPPAPARKRRPHAHLGA